MLVAPLGALTREATVDRVLRHVRDVHRTSILVDAQGVFRIFMRLHRATLEMTDKCIRKVAFWLLN